MDLTSGQARLNKAYKSLRIRWDHARESWRDDNARTFERDHIDTLEPKVLAALSAMERLGSILSQMERDCG